MSNTEWHGRGSPQYNPSVHLPLLHKVFGECDGVAAFCAQADISERTFFSWRDKHSEFKQEYEIALCKGAAVWERKPLEMAERNLKLNHNFWMVIYRNRYMSSQHRIEEPKDNTTASRMAAAWIAMQTGGITPQEYNQIASGLATESKISEIELQRQIVEQLQKSTEENKEVTDEALRGFMLIKSGKGRVVLNE